MFQAVIALSGDFFGFDFTLRVDPHYSMHAGLDRFTGARIILHEPRSRPIVQSGGIRLATNTKSNIGLSKFDIQRLKHPFESDCSDTWPEWLGKGQEILKYPYSKAICENFCLEEHVARKCNCSYQPLVEFKRKIHRSCEFTSPIDAACMYDILGNFDANAKEALTKENCGCKDVCHEVEYMAHASNFQWPSEAYWPDLAALYNVSHKGTLITQDYVSQLVANGSLSEVMYLRDLVQGQFVSVKVYYETKSVTYVKELAKYNFESLLSSFGGAFSLYLGVSLVALFEVVELVFRLAGSVFSR